MEVVEVGDEVQGVVEVARLLLTLLSEQPCDIHIPRQEQLLLLRVELARLYECCIDRLGRELQRTQQIFQLPQVEDVLGNILFAFLLCYIHFRNLLGKDTKKLRVESVELRDFL